MNQYTVSVAVHHKKLLKVNAVDEDEAIEKAEITVFDTDALKYDGDDLVSAEFDIFLPRDASFLLTRSSRRRRAESRILHRRRSVFCKDSARNHSPDSPNSRCHRG